MRPDSSSRIYGKDRQLRKKQRICAVRDFMPLPLCLISHFPEKTAKHKRNPHVVVVPAASNKLLPTASNAEEENQMSKKSSSKTPAQPVKADPKSVGLGAAGKHYNKV